MTTNNPFGRLYGYLRASLEEAKKITWPTRKETFRYSLLVIVITLLVAAFFGALDYGFNLALEAIL